MPVLRCYVSESDEKELIEWAGKLGRSVEDLAEAAISEAVVNARRSIPKSEDAQSAE